MIWQQTRLLGFYEDKGDVHVKNIPELQSIPQVDALLRCSTLAKSGLPRAALTRAVRAEVTALRERVLADASTENAGEMEVLAQRALARARREEAPWPRRVINATGVALHTNLGRAPLCADAVRAVTQAAGGYTALEYDVESGMRGSRGARAEALLCELTGAEAALIVNNNAAAVLLALASLMDGERREVILSRGELVEIGSSFRVPDILAESGAVLMETGMTNKTHLRDYEAALSPRTAAILKVHTSNYRVVGFTGDVAVRELAALGKRAGVPVVYDIGSGALLPERCYPFSGEPTVPQALADGADLITFSGDKLLGGPQAGIILGKKEYVERMRKRPLCRALRPDKLTLAALEATLRLYREPDRARREIPALQMLCEGEAVLQQKAQRLLILLQERGIAADAVQRERPVGGGSVPCQSLHGAAVALAAQDSAALLEGRLRAGDIPVVACISENRVLLDVSTVAEAELPVLAGEVARAW